MAKCNYCGKDYLKDDGCDAFPIEFNGKIYERVKVGDPGDFYEDASADTRCGDCGAKVGHYHHVGCDCERCPVCGLQFISCDCDY